MGLRPALQKFPIRDLMIRMPRVMALSMSARETKPGRRLTLPVEHATDHAANIDLLSPSTARKRPPRRQKIE